MLQIFLKILASAIFNIEDLVDYKGLDFSPRNPLVNKPSPESFLRALTTPTLRYSPNVAERVDKILADEIIATRTHRYLIRWKGKVRTDDTWLDQDDLQRIDLNALEQYESTSTPKSTGSSSLLPGKNDADI